MFILYGLHYFNDQNKYTMVSSKTNQTLCYFSHWNRRSNILFGSRGIMYNYGYYLPLTIYFQVGSAAQWILQLTSKRNVVDLKLSFG